ncbi:MAG: MmcQ/YjbR family DNA-binding protein [Pseudomonadota bacterium]
MRWQDIVEFALRWPEVVESTSYGEPSLKVRKRLLTRTRLDDDSLVLLDVPAEEREMLIVAAPRVFFVEEHYRDYDIVLAWLATLTRQDVEPLLERRWRNSATKRAIARFDAERGGNQ